MTRNAAGWSGVLPDVTDDLRPLLVDDLDAGFAALVRRHQQLLLAVARRTTGDRTDAEDLAAEALLRAYRALRGWDAERIAALEVRGWLLTVLLNVRRNDLRTAARRPRADRGPGDGEPPDVPTRGPSVEDQALPDPHLAAALASLSPVQRTAVVLRHVADLPVGEVATALGCAEGTARSHVSRGLARLRAALCAHDTLERSTP